MGHPASYSRLVSKLAHCGTGPYKVLLVGPGKAPDGDLVGRKLLLLDTSHEDSRRINARVSVHRCKRCFNPHEGERRPQFMPWAMSSHVLIKYSDLSPPFNLSVDDVNMETDSFRVTPRSIVSHRILRGFSGTVSVQYLTSWKTGKDFLGNRAGTGAVRQYGGALLGGRTEASRRGKREYRAYRVQMAKRSQARSAGKVYVPPGHKLSCDPRCSPDMCSPDSVGSYIFLKTAGNGWQFAKMVEHGNICQRGGCSGSRVLLVVRERAVARSTVAIREGRYDNDDTTFDSFPLICIGGCISVMGGSIAAAGRSSFERAIVTWSRPATSAVTMMIGSWQHTDHMC